VGKELCVFLLEEDAQEGVIRKQDGPLTAQAKRRDDS
jgi:hypothetical protein